MVDLKISLSYFRYLKERGTKEEKLAFFNLFKKVIDNEDVLYSMPDNRLKMLVIKCLRKSKNACDLLKHLEVGFLGVDNIKKIKSLFYHGRQDNLSVYSELKRLNLLDKEVELRLLSNDYRVLTLLDNVDCEHIEAAFHNSGKVFELANDHSRIDKLLKEMDYSFLFLKDCSFVFYHLSEKDLAFVLKKINQVLVNNNNDDLKEKLNTFYFIQVLKDYRLFKLFLKYDDFFKSCYGQTLTLTLLGLDKNILIDDLVNKGNLLNNKFDWIHCHKKFKKKKSVKKFFFVPAFHFANKQEKQEIRDLIGNLNENLNADLDLIKREILNLNKKTELEPFHLDCLKIIELEAKLLYYWFFLDELKDDWQNNDDFVSFAFDLLENELVMEILNYIDDDQNSFDYDSTSKNKFLNRFLEVLVIKESKNELTMKQASILEGFLGKLIKKRSVYFENVDLTVLSDEMKFGLYVLCAESHIYTNYPININTFETNSQFDKLKSNDLSTLFPVSILCRLSDETIMAYSAYNKENLKLLILKENRANKKDLNK